MHDRDVDDALDCPSRRGVLRSLAGIGVTTIAAGVLVACGSPNSSSPTGDTATSGPGSSDAASSDADSSDADSSDPASAEASVPLADVPVGQAVVVDALGSRFVLAQPTAGAVVAFSATCTHAGTQVEATGGLEVRCPNHGSRFDAGDGAAVVNGPAVDPLPAVQARIEGDLVLLSA